ncbi:MAG: acyltransferase family protein, partial [Faecalibacterium sp.]
MQTTKPRTVSSIGMFDLLKGVGMLTIVFVHTAELYSFDMAGGTSLTTFFPFIYRESLMAAFYIASGYGFRKRSIGKCIEQQCKSLLKPYVFTALATTVLHFI